MNEKIKKFKFFKRWILLWTGLWFGMVFFSASPASADAARPLEDVVSRIQRLYDNTQDLSAGFVQETTIQSIRKTDVEKGMVYFKTPRRMLWDYTWPKPKKLVVNPKTAWLYLPDEKVAYRQDADRLFQSATLIKFLSGIGKLTDDFVLSFATPEATDASGNYLLALTPKEKNTSYQSLRMTIDHNSFHILQVGFDDVLGNTTVLKFHDIRLNAKINPALFQFKPAADVSIFDMP